MQKDWTVPTYSGNGSALSQFEESGGFHNVISYLRDCIAICKKYFFLCLFVLLELQKENMTKNMN